MFKEVRFALFFSVRSLCENKASRSSFSFIVTEKVMPVFVGVMNATPLLPNESSKLNLNGGSFAVA